MAYSEELNMFRVHHYSPIPILHAYTYMCIYPDCDKRVDSQFMAKKKKKKKKKRKNCNIAFLLISHTIYNIFSPISD